MTVDLTTWRRLGPPESVVRAWRVQILLRTGYLREMARQRSSKAPTPRDAERIFRSGTTKQILEYILGNLRRHRVPREETVKIMVRIAPCAGCGRSDCWFCYPGDTRPDPESSCTPSPPS